MSTYITVPEAANRVGVPEQTFRYWLSTGKVNKRQRAKGRKVLVLVSEVEKIIKARERKASGSALRTAPKVTAKTNGNGTRHQVEVTVPISFETPQSGRRVYTLEEVASFLDVTRDEVMQMGLPVIQVSPTVHRIPQSAVDALFKTGSLG